MVDGREQSVDLGYVGDGGGEPEVIQTLSRNGYIPVISSIGTARKERG